MISAASAAALADAIDGGIVFGADLGAPTELLVSHDSTAANAVLHRLGFVLAAGTWARATDTSVEAVRVRVHPLHGEILEHAVTVGGVSRPGPHHLVLLCAERLISDPSVETPVVVALAQSALTEDARAWAAALKRGLDWGLWRALAHLERGLAGASVTPADREDARRELDRVRGGSSLVSVVRPGVLALSGVDGAGKSSQARSLRAALEAAGVPAAVEWTRVAADRRLDRIAGPVLALARRVRGGKPTKTRGDAVQPDRAAAGRSLRERHRLVGQVWAYIVIGLAVSTQRTSTRLHSRQGRWVIRDRYLLDAVVQLRDDYGVRCGRLARWVLTRLAPRPLAAFLLVVTPEEALARKHEQYDLADLQRLCSGYGEGAAELEVRAVDGSRPATEISREIFTAVWARLAQTTSASSANRTG